MGRINIDDIQPGMVLATEVQDQNGRTLLSAGHELTEKHIKIFKMWGVVDADIQGVDREQIAAKAVNDLDPVLVQEAEARAKELFAHADLEHPVVRELFRLCTIRLVRQQRGGGAHGL